MLQTPACISEERLPQTQEEFEEALDFLRSTPVFVVSRLLWEEDGTKVGAMIYADDVLVEIIDPVDNSEENMAILSAKLAETVEKIKNPIRLWKGARGTLSRAINIPITKGFNRWFDYFADELAKDGPYEGEPVWLGNRELNGEVK